MEPTPQDYTSGLKWISHQEWGRAGWNPRPSGRSPTTSPGGEKRGLEDQLQREHNHPRVGRRSVIDRRSYSPRGCHLSRNLLTRHISRDEHNKTSRPSGWGRTGFGLERVQFTPKGARVVSFSSQLSALSFQLSAPFLGAEKLMNTAPNLRILLPSAPRGRGL